jgi:sec-independent protein translocase protein TatC
MSEDSEQSIWDHLEELAQRLRIIILSVVIMTLIFAVFPSDPSVIWRLDFSENRALILTIMEIVQNGLLPNPDVNLIAFNWMDTFYIYILVSVILGVISSVPVIAYQLFKFIAPALYPNERKWVVAFTVSFIALFSLGAVYAYFILLPTTFKVLYGFVFQSRVIPFFSVKDFYNMVAVGMLGSGIFYTFPLVLFLLVQADLLEVSTLKKNRKQFFIVMLIVTAILTPDPTPFTMLLMSIPFYVLFEGTIQILSRMKKPKPDIALEEGIRASKEFLERPPTPEISDDYDIPDDGLSSDPPPDDPQ